MNTSQSESEKKVKVIVFDQHEENKILKEAADKIKKFSMLVRNSGFNVIKCINPEYDPECKKITTATGKNYACVELGLPQTGSKQARIKQFEAFLTTRKYKVVASQIFVHGDDSSAKIIVAL